MPRSSEGQEISDQTASNDLRKLVAADLLVEVGETRGRIYHGAPATLGASASVRQARPKPGAFDRFRGTPRAQLGQLDLPAGISS